MPIVPIRRKKRRKNLKVKPKLQLKQNKLMSVRKIYSGFRQMDTKILMKMLITMLLETHGMYLQSANKLALNAFDDKRKFLNDLEREQLS